MTSHYLEGVSVDIVGINISDRGCSCKKHTFCGVVFEVDTDVRIRLVQIEVDVLEVACYWVTNGIDHGQVGFLQRFSLKHSSNYDGKLAQVVKVFYENSDSPSDKAKHHRIMGCCHAVILNVPKSKRKKAPLSLETSDAKKPKAKQNDNKDD